MCFLRPMQPPREGRIGSGYAITALAAAVALVCLVVGFRLMSQDSPDEIRAWLADPLVRSGLALALGGALLVFLLSAALLLAIRRQIDSPRRKIGRGAQAADPTGLDPDSAPVDSPVTLVERELARWLAAQDRTPDSHHELQESARRLRETLQDAERILAGIEAVVDETGRDPEPDRPPAGDSTP